jgi:hypothetical protein
LCDVVCLLLVLSIILHYNNMSMCSMQKHGTHFGLLLRVDMMDTIDSFYFFAVPNTIPGSKAIRYMSARIWIIVQTCSDRAVGKSSRDQRSRCRDNNMSYALNLFANTLHVVLRGHLPQQEKVSTRPGGDRRRLLTCFSA